MRSRFEAVGLSLLVLYFAYHAFAGEKGLGRWTDAQIELQDRKAELAHVAELRHEAHRRTNHKLELMNVNSLLAHLYRPQLRPSLEARKAALEAAIKESLGQ